MIAGLKDYLIASPSAAAKPETQGIPRIGSLVSALSKNNIDSKASLCAAWSLNPLLLYSELAAWMRRGQVAHLKTRWPLLKNECSET